MNNTFQEGNKPCVHEKPLPPLYRSTILRTASKPFARQKRLRKSLKRAKKIVSSSFVLRTPFLVQADHLPRSLPLLWGGGKRDTMTRNIIPGYLVASSMFQRAAGAVSKSNIISGGALEQANTSVGGVWRGSYRRGRDLYAARSVTRLFNNLDGSIVCRSSRIFIPSTGIEGGIKGAICVTDLEIA